MSADESAAAGLAPSAERAPARRAVAGDVFTAVVWLAGCAAVVAAQPGLDRKGAAAAAAAAGIGMILVVAQTTEDPGRRYFRSLLGAIVAVSLTATWLVSRLTGITYTFRLSDLDKKIVLPLLFVLAVPLTARALPLRVRGVTWRELRGTWRLARPMDWVMVGYAVLSVPALLLGLFHHASRTYIAQDLGLAAFFLLMYVAGRAVRADVAHDVAGEFVDVLLLLGVAQFMFLDWVPEPLYVYVEPACAAALAVVLLRPRSIRFLPVGLAVVLLASEAAQVGSGSNSTTAVELAGALAVLAYVLVRLWPPLPRWLVVAGAAAVLVVFVGFTSDGATVRGQYHGPDPSNAGRTFEAEQVRAEVRASPLSLALGRGFGATIDERRAPAGFRHSLANAGRDLAHVPQVHLLEYQFLLEFGLAGAVWLALFVLGLCWMALRGLERAVRERDASFVIYAALPLLVLAQAFAAAAHLQDNPLGALALGMLVALLGSGARELPPTRA